QTFRSRGASSSSAGRARTAGAIAPRRQAGAALFVSLVLLLLLTLLAVSGMRSAALELAMAGNAQARQHAFEAAESAIEVALSQRTFSTSATVPLRVSLGAAEAEAAVTFIQTTGVPDAAFSLGVG